MKETMRRVKGIYGAETLPTISSVNFPTAIPA